MKKKRRAPTRQEIRTEEVEVDLGTFQGTTVTLTYTVDASAWSDIEGVAGLISIRPTQLTCTDENGARTERL